MKGKGYKYCYYNAQILLIRSSGRLKYYEGYALSSRRGIVHEHAWNVLNGKVIDLTWGEDAVEYFGVHIPTSYVRKNIFKTHSAEQLIIKYVIKKIGVR
jgi:hypothetical protein